MSHVASNFPADQGAFESPAVTETPNVVVQNPAVRKYAGLVLYVVAVLAALAALFFGIFPEVGGDIVNRALLFTNSAVSFLAGVFGLAITIPNVPRAPR